MRGLLAVVTAIALLVTSAWRGWIELPERWNPWAPLRIDSPPDTFTRFRLSHLAQDAPACRAFLATTGIRFEAVPDRSTGAGCGLTDAVRIDALPAQVGTPFALSCRTAASLALWLRHVVEPAAREQLGSPLIRIEHFGSYACRNVYSREGANRSRHATAEALDVAGFVLQDGRRIRVLGEWTRATTDAAFLHAVRDGACGVFDAVLSPDYNAAHRDHLHLDRGTWRLCR